MENKFNNEDRREIGDGVAIILQEEDETTGNVVFDMTPDDNFFESFVEWENEDPTDAGEYMGERSMWLGSAVKLLLSLVAELRGKVGKSPKLKNKQKMWQQIKEKLNETGFDFTEKQIQNKFHALERAYKKTKSHNASTGRNRQSCRYERELDEILGKRPVINPEFVLGAKLDEFRAASESVPEPRREGSPEPGPSNCQASTPAPTAVGSGERRRRPEKKKLIDIMEDMRKEQAQHNNKVLEFLEKSTEDRNRLLKEKMKY